MWGLGLRADDPKAPRSLTVARGKIARESSFRRSRHLFAQVRPDQHTPPPLTNFALRPRPAEFMRFHQRRPALLPWPTPAQVLLWSFRHAFLTRLLTTVPRFWLSYLVRPLPRAVRTRPPSSGAPLSSMTPLLQPKSRFPAELALSHLLVVWIFSTLAPHRLSSDEMFWITCSRLLRHPSRARRNAPPALTNRPL